MSHKDLEKFSKIIDFFPAIFWGNPLNLLFLNDAQKIDNPRHYLKDVSGPILWMRKRIFSSKDIDEGLHFPFPTYSVYQRPEPEEVSEMLFQRFEIASKFILSQNDIAEQIVDLANKKKPEIIVLILVDGLSYYDLPENDSMQPCLVPGVSNTEFGFTTIISKPSISSRLFFSGYKKQRAFSFFDYTNLLSANIHEGFSESQYTRIKKVSEIYRSLKRLQPRKDYIQIVIDGLDGLCHRHHDEPPIDFYKKRIIDCLDEIETIFSSKIRYQIHLVSDHGILWQNSYNNFVIIDDLFPEESYHPRYTKGSFNRLYGRICSSKGSNYTLFKAPYLSRNFRNNEWGVHGGISAWESIVPFITRTG